MMKRKSLLAVLAVVMCVCVCVGGTIAYLIAQTDPVVNTFTPSGIEVTLAETEGSVATANGFQYKVIPGHTAKKDPTVTVTNPDVDAYVFVKITGNVPATADFAANNSVMISYAVSYVIADGWTQLNGDPISGVYYRVVEKDATEKKFGVLKDNEIKFLETLSAEVFAGTAVPAPTNNQFTMSGTKLAISDWSLTFDAYAVQYYKNDTPAVGEDGSTIVDPNGTPFTPAEAWAQVNPTT